MRASVQIVRERPAILRNSPWKTNAQRLLLDTGVFWGGEGG